MQAKDNFTVEILVDAGKNIVNFKKLINLKSSPGWIISENRVEEWHFSGFTSRDDKFYIQGPARQGLSLGQVLDLPLEQALNLLIGLAGACEKLMAHTPVPFSLQLDSVYFLNNGGILFLPPDIVKKAREFNPESYRFAVFTGLNNTYLLDQRARISYSLGCLFFRLAAGVFPFQGADETEVHGRIRAYNIVSPTLSCPAMKPELAEFFRDFFSDKLNFNIALADWEKILVRYRDQGMTREISASEKEEVLSQAQTQAEKNQKRFKWHLFIEKQGKTILVATLLSVLACFAVFTYLGEFFKPRLTRGFSPRQVVEAFYQGLNELNPQIMEDSALPEAGNPELSEVRNLFVTTRQQFTLGVRRYIPASEWDRLGRPLIGLGQFVYGVTDLKLTQEEYGEKPVFFTVFHKWVFAEVQEDESALTTYPAGYEMSERLYLRRDGEYWIIFKRVRLKEEALFKK